MYLKVRAHMPEQATFINHAESFQLSALERSLRRRAADAGTTIEALRRADREWLKSDAYPTAECFDPFEIEKFFTAALPAERAEHLETCPICAALVEAAAPSSERFQEFSRFLLAASEQQQTSQTHGWKPIRDVCKIELPMIVALVAFGLWVFWRQDAIVSSLLADRSARLVLIFTAIICAPIVAAAAGAKWLSVWFPLFDRYGGVVLGTGFVCVVLLYCGHLTLALTRSYDGIKQAQQALFETIAQNQKTGLVYADSLYQKKLETGRGSLVAARDSGGFDIYWERGRTRRTIAKVYEGKIERESNGAIKIKTDGRDLDVKSSSKQPKWTDGDNVVALVQKNESVPTFVMPTLKFAQ